MTHITNDITLLDDMMSRPYSIGPYWRVKVANILREIKRCGLQDFRGCSNGVGLSYTDSMITDIRYSLSRRVIRWLSRNRIFDSQVKWTKHYADLNIKYAQKILEPKAVKLLTKYKMPYSLLGGCRSKAKDVSIHYLETLSMIDNMGIDFSKVRSVFEIGGGFGSNIHLLLENFKNIKKVLYLDIPPNLYVGTQYLKAFYPVKDYSELKTIERLRFSANNELEIFCIAPWQIEKFDGGIDIFMNSNSFVEMQREVVLNYADIISRICKAIVLTTYENCGTDTIPPEDLLKFFDRKFESFEREKLLEGNNLYFISKTEGRL